MKFIKKQNRYCLLLAQSFLFSEVDRPTVDTAFLSEECTCFEFEPGEKIYTRNHYDKSLGIVLSGELQAVKPESVALVLNTFYSGGIFGVAALFTNARQYVSDVVVVKRSRVLFLPQGILQGLFEVNSKIAENYISYLSNRICFLNGRIDNFTGGTAECRFANFLVSLSGRKNHALEFELPCTLTQLSNTLNIGRASLYRAIDDLSVAGIIKRSGKNIAIIDIDRLKSGQF